ncbi:MAG TPA: TlpA disulfide reductase family protein [Pseudomonadales bacterium]|jgi:thiol-disulfide isomerase/thioredoxin
MKAKTSSLLLAGALFLAGCDFLGQADEPPLALADGTTMKVDDWHGRWLLINYWAEWCAPCRKEIPELNRLQAEVGEERLLVIGVNFDGLTGQRLTELIEKMDVRFPVLVEDPRGRWDVEQPTVLPSTLVIAPNGRLKEVLVGPHTFESFSRALGLTAST